MHALPGIVDGARKTSQVGSWVRDRARGRGCRFSSLPMLETTTTSRDQCIIECCNLCHVALWCERKRCGRYSTANIRSWLNRCPCNISIPCLHPRNLHRKDGHNFTNGGQGASQYTADRIQSNSLTERQRFSWSFRASLQLYRYSGWARSLVMFVCGVAMSP